MVFLFRFLSRNLKGYRWLVVLAVLVSIAGVVCTLAAAFPIKFITSKVGSQGNDPACTLRRHADIPGVMAAKLEEKPLIRHDAVSKRADASRGRGRRRPA